MGIDEKYIELMLLSIDNEITLEQQQELNAYLVQNPDAVIEYEQLKKTVVHMDNKMVYTNKEALLDIANTTTFSFTIHKNLIRAAAILLPIIAITFYYIFQKPSHNSEEYVTVGKNTVPQQLDKKEAINASSQQPMPVQFTEENNIVVENNTGTKEKTSEAIAPITNEPKQAWQNNYQTQIETISQNNTQAIDVYQKIVLPTAEGKQEYLPMNINIVAPEQPIVAATNGVTTLDLGLVDLNINNADSGKLAKNIRKGMAIFKAAKEIAQNGIELNVNY